VVWSHVVRQPLFCLGLSYTGQIEPIDTRIRRWVWSRKLVRPLSFLVQELTEQEVQRVVLRTLSFLPEESWWLYPFGLVYLDTAQTLFGSLRPRRLAQWIVRVPVRPLGHSFLLSFLLRPELLRLWVLRFSFSKRAHEKQNLMREESWNTRGKVWCSFWCSFWRPKKMRPWNYYYFFFRIRQKFSILIILLSTFKNAFGKHKHRNAHIWPPKSNSRNHP
jgi:hypothetical protein